MIIQLADGRNVPVEMHRVKTVQKINLLPAAERLNCLRSVGYNTFLLPSREVFLDMLTDSGTNAMSDNQLAAMMVADDAYAGSESFFKLAKVVKKVFGFEHTLPVHQGRAAEHLQELAGDAAVRQCDGPFMLRDERERFRDLPWAPDRVHGNPGPCNPPL